MPTSEAHNCDCLDFMRQLPDGYFDLLISDPVYGEVTGGGYTTSAYDGKEHHIGNTAANQLAYHRAVWKMPKTPPEHFKEMFRVSKNQVIWGGNFFTDCLPPSQGWIVWDKKRPEGITFSDCELAFTSFNVGLRIFRFMWNGMLQENMKNKEQKCHPCQKPVVLYKWILSRYAKPGDKIFDPYLGSGSSRIAAWDLGFDFVGCEIDKTYFDLMEKRFREHTKQTRMEL